jgi:hypothetical protein
MTNECVASALDADKTSRVLAQLSVFAESYPRSSAPRRLALDIAQGNLIHP